MITSNKANFLSRPQRGVLSYFALVLPVFYHWRPPTLKFGILNGVPTRLIYQFSNDLLLYVSIPSSAILVVFDSEVSGAGISDNSTTPRTLWPLDRGSLKVNLHNATAYIFFNLGLGVNTTNFLISLFSVPLNETRTGKVCFPKLTLPSGLLIPEGFNNGIMNTTVSKGI